MKRMFVSDLQEGMVVGRDACTSTGLLIIPAGVVVTEPIIEHLLSLGLEEIYIDEKAEERPEPPLKKQHFVEFNNKYIKTKDKLNNTFGKILKGKDAQEEIDELINSSWKMMDQDANSFEILSMLYSMHNYSDTTYMHCMNVGMIAALIGKWLGWSKEDQKVLNACGMFHDIGKLAISKNILEKPGKLTDEEYGIMKSHTVRGYELIRPYALDQRILNATLLHHERCDGTGYPLRLLADKLDDYTKIIAIADVYEAMTANRVYRKSICPFDVIAQFENNGFELYDTKILLVFLHNIVDTYLNSNVTLSDGQKASVILINRQKGSKPIVMTTDGKAVDLLKETNLKIAEVID